MRISHQQTREQYHWGIRFEQQAHEILGRELGPRMVYRADDYLDTNQATDAVVGGGLGFRVAVRIRRHRYLRAYGNEFTLRAVPRGGTKSEFEKVLEGFGDFLFYGFSNHEETGLEAWRILDLGVFRDHALDVGRSYKKNTTGENFAVFVVREFPPNLIVAQAQYFHNNDLAFQAGFEF